MSEPVPGPWIVEIVPDCDSDNYVYTVKEQRPGDILGICDLNRYSKDHETLVATAELIASAPTLRAENARLRGLLAEIQFDCEHVGAIQHLDKAERRTWISVAKRIKAALQPERGTRQ